MKKTPGLLTQLTAVPLERPCDQSWAAMHGDDRVRHCVACARDVLDLSAMTALQAELRLLNAGPRPCIRYYRDRDGAVHHLPPLPSERLPSRPSRALVAAAFGVTLGGSVVHAEEPKTKREPEQCVAYVTQQELDGAIVAKAAPSAGAGARASSVAAGPSASKNAEAAGPAAEVGYPPQMLAGGAVSPSIQPATGTLRIKSKIPREVTLVGLALKAPFEAYRLTPRAFVAEVREANGKTRKVKFTIKVGKTTIVDLDKP